MTISYSVVCARWRVRVLLQAAAAAFDTVCSSLSPVLVRNLFLNGSRQRRPFLSLGSFTRLINNTVACPRVTSIFDPRSPHAHKLGSSCVCADLK